LRDYGVDVRGGTAGMSAPSTTQPPVNVSNITPAQLSIFKSVLDAYKKSGMSFDPSIAAFSLGFTDLANGLRNNNLATLMNLKALLTCRLMILAVVCSFTYLFMLWLLTSWTYSV
jgi:hypothetical protein